jgi:hypothetical protein
MTTSTPISYRRVIDEPLVDPRHAIYEVPVDRPRIPSPMRPTWPT